MKLRPEDANSDANVERIRKIRREIVSKFKTKDEYFAYIIERDHDFHLERRRHASAAGKRKGTAKRVHHKTETDRQPNRR